MGGRHTQRGRQVARHNEPVARFTQTTSDRHLADSLSFNHTDNELFSDCACCMSKHSGVIFPRTHYDTAISEEVEDLVLDCRLCKLPLAYEHNAPWVWASYRINTDCFPYDPVLSRYSYLSPPHRVCRNDSGEDSGLIAGSIASFRVDYVHAHFLRHVSKVGISSAREIKLIGSERKQSE